MCLLFVLQYILMIRFKNILNPIIYLQKRIDYADVFCDIFTLLVSVDI